MNGAGKKTATAGLALVGGILLLSVMTVIQVGLVSKAQKMDGSNNNGCTIGVWKRIVTREDERDSLSRFKSLSGLWWGVSWGGSSFAQGENCRIFPEG
ncbi:MAG: hypothetical protein ACYCT9_09590 [Leptospirillum sp.]